ncbi:MAG: hypothetical protein K2J59_00975 [Eubacterium sp.]|nr:hypothetical protein [Eubacterium sp.]
MNYFKERFNKRFLKNGIKALSFVLIIAVILLALSPVFMPKTNKGLKDKSAQGFLAEPDNSIDVVFVGDSLAYSSFIPLKIFNDYGISSYVCCTPSQTLAYSEDFVRRAFKNQKPKLVVLETDGVFRRFNPLQSLVLRAEEFLPIYRYHDRWKNLKLADFSSEFSSDYIVNDKGFRLYGGVKSAATKDYMKPSEKKASIPLKNKAYIENIKALCEENGAELMLVSAPCVKNWSCEKHNTVHELAEKLGVEYMDMNYMQEEIPIDWSKESRDGGEHLNYAGAEKVTSYFGAYLNSKNIFTDHRNDKSFEDWNKAYKSFLKEVEKIKKQNKLNPDKKSKKTKS